LSETKAHEQVRPSLHLTTTCTEPSA
jgi:hypothetical protein